MRWTRHVACMREKRNAYIVFLVESLEERNYWEDLGVVWRIFLKWLVKKWDGMARTGFVWSWVRTGSRLGEHSNESLSSIKCGKLLD